MASTEWRYEWRIWGSNLEESRSRLEQLGSPSTVKRSDDLYLIGPNRHVNAKIRDDVVETKTLVDVDNGFEQWRPDRSEDLPAPASVVAQLLADLGLSCSAVDQADEAGSDTEVVSVPDGLVDQSLLLSLVSQSGLAVPVRKRRHHFTIGEATIAEAVEVTVGGHRRWTVAIEGSEVDELARLRSELGLVGVNTPMHVKAAELVAIDGV